MTDLPEQDPGSYAVVTHDHADEGSAAQRVCAVYRELHGSRAILITEPQLMLYPGAAISVVVIGFNLLGDGLRDLLDPQLQA